MLCTNFPKIELAADVKIWLSAAYERAKSGRRIEPQEMLVELWPEIPDFKYRDIDDRLMIFGVQPTLLGILQIDPDTELCTETDQVIRFIQAEIRRQPAIENVTAEMVSGALKIPEQRVELILSLISHLGTFWSSAAGSAKGYGYTAITIRDEHIKREFLRYERLELLLRRFAKVDEAVEPREPEIVHKLLDWKLREHLSDAATITDAGNGNSRKEMSDLHQNALKIARYLYSNNLLGTQSITATELQDRTKLSEEDFEIADEYLLNANICAGTSGGDAGLRWLTSTGVEFVQMNKRENSKLSEEQHGSAVDIFISHSSKDVETAKALVRLFRAALNIAAHRIRCTSVDGYRLPAGAETNNQLRRELRESKVFLGLITQASVESTYVLFELGARWGADLPLAPVLVSSKDRELLRGPLSGFNALACDSQSQILQLLEDVASQLGITPEKAASYQEHIEALHSVATGSSRQQSHDLNLINPEVDFERMAKHVANHLAAKRLTKHAKFESVRLHVNSDYSDQLLLELIEKFPDRFRRVMLRTGQPAIGLVKR